MLQEKLWLSKGSNRSVLNLSVTYNWAFHENLPTTSHSLISEKSSTTGVPHKKTLLVSSIIFRRNFTVIPIFSNHTHKYQRCELHKNGDFMVKEQYWPWSRDPNESRILEFTRNFWLLYKHIHIHTFPLENTTPSFLPSTSPPLSWQTVQASRPTILVFRDNPLKVGIFSEPQKY